MAEDYLNGEKLIVLEKYGINIMIPIDMIYRRRVGCDLNAHKLQFLPKRSELVWSRDEVKYINIKFAEKKIQY